MPGRDMTDDDGQDELPPEDTEVVESEPTGPTEHSDEPPPADPFGRAESALAAAREARGAQPESDPETPLDPSDPFAAAERALERAREAQAGVRGRATMARESDALAQLERLKAGHFVSPDDETEEEDPAHRPRRRTL